MPIQSFFEGIIAALGALALELSPPICGLTLDETSILFLFFTASIEEMIKFIFIYNRYLKLANKEKILASAFFIGLGFAFIDIILKQLPYEKDLLLPIAGVFLVHLLTASLLGLLLLKKKQKLLLLGLAVLFLNILLHFFYNFLILHYS